MQIRLIQTADADRYKVLFDITSRASIKFCELQQLEFVPFIGIKRGWHPWQASFNRIVMLRDMIEEGFTGWVLYLDADAYPFSLDFDIRAYLHAHAHWAIIAPAGGHSAYMPNTGIMFFNFANPATRAVIMSWHAAFLRELPDDLLQSAPDWIEQDDQYLLHPILHQRGDYDRIVKIESFDLIGWPRSRVIRQVLRSLHDFRTRCKLALAGVQQALAESDNPNPPS